MTNLPHLYLFGKELLENLNLCQYRKEFTFTSEDIKNDLSIKNFIKNLVEDNFLIEIIHKQIPDNGINWHLDDAQIITTKNYPKINKERYIKISDNKYLYRNNIPQYTIIFYLSTYKKDFDGGILKFCDDKKIEPRYGYGFMFDSREIHMVTPIKSGIRNVIVCKLYSSNYLSNNLSNHFS